MVVIYVILFLVAFFAARILIEFCGDD